MYHNGFNIFEFIQPNLCIIIPLHINLLQVSLIHYGLHKCDTFKTFLQLLFSYVYHFSPHILFRNNEHNFLV